LDRAVTFLDKSGKNPDQWAKNGFVKCFGHYFEGRRARFDMPASLATFIVM